MPENDSELTETRPKTNKSRRKLKDRYRRFAQEYVIDLNGTRAAIAAGFNSISAHARASELVKNRKVMLLIDELNSQRASKLAITAEKLDEECARIAFANMADYLSIDQDGKPNGIDLEKVTRDQWAAVQEIREDTTGGSGDGERKRVLRTTLKLGDKTKNLELLYRRLGLLEDKVKVTILDGLADKLHRIRTQKANGHVIDVEPKKLEEPKT